MAQFELRAFVEAPSREALEGCRKADMLQIAAHFNLELPTPILKRDLKTLIMDYLTDQGLLQSSSPVASSPDRADPDLDPNLTDGGESSMDGNTGELSKGHARMIARYQENYNASERSLLIIYLDKVSHTKPEEITFRVHQMLKVDVLQPAVVSVYKFNTHQYVDQDSDQNRCVKFYHPERRAGKLLRLCRNETCTCAEENCSRRKLGNVNNDERTAKVCETQLSSKIEYVYKVKVQEVEDSLSTDVYTVKVLNVIKEGGSVKLPSR
ncbi:complement C3 alpha chain-like [Nothobranchius furzeri]|uniref:Complement C3 alpha chain-like n=1 Tax=Nothobranchius furzeri TaxID=105023 RepID=A0A9D2YQR2_NOTFU|nr:complement C3 alpha chain-like [Nothobranchius furzeri]